MRRREFLATAGAATAGVMAGRSGLFAAERKASADRPNVVVIITDQQFADAMSCAIGRDYIHTPNMDSIAENGMRFTRAYCANPLCVPSRASMFSGRYPHETGVQTNSRGRLDPKEFPCMGRLFRDAGYDTGFFGKWHMPFAEKDKTVHGFDTVGGRGCIYTGEPVAKFIAAERSGPFLAVASFMNPHNICEWSRGQKLPGGPIGPPPAPDKCPPPKPNMTPPAGETDVMTHMRRAYQAHRLFPVGKFTDDKWRQYRWAYYRLVEKVDRHVGTVLAAVRKSGQARKTVVVFLSDHGECHGTHRWNQKTVFYDESARVPLIISQPGKTPKGTCDSLAQTGIDLIPTICDFAGIDVPAKLPGISLKPHATGKAPKKGRPYVVVQNHLVQCVPVDGVSLKPQGRMVRSDRYKYCLYSEGKRRESLVDMQGDPGEMTNLAARPEAPEALLTHRGYLQQFARKHNDTVALRMLKALEG